MAYVGPRRAQYRSVASLQWSRKQCPPVEDWTGTLEPSLPATGWVRCTHSVVALLEHQTKGVDSGCGPVAGCHWCHGGCREKIHVQIICSATIKEELYKYQSTQSACTCVQACKTLEGGEASSFSHIPSPSRKGLVLMHKILYFL